MSDCKSSSIFVLSVTLSSFGLPIVSKLTRKPANRNLNIRGQQAPSTNDRSRATCAFLRSVIARGSDPIFGNHAVRRKECGLTRMALPLVAKRLTSTCNFGQFSIRADRNHVRQPRTKFRGDDTRSAIVS